MSTNTITLLGRLANDPIIGTLPNSDRSVLEIRLAVDRPTANKDDADFFPVTLYGRDADAVDRLSGKGRRISVTGRLRTDSWDKDGEKRYKTFVVADNVTIIDFPPRDSDDAASSDREQVAA
jgi:single-strand DNA-binding protein